MILIILLQRNPAVPANRSLQLRKSRNINRRGPAVVPIDTAARENQKEDRLVLETPT